MSEKITHGEKGRGQKDQERDDEGGISSSIDGSEYATKMQAQIEKSNDGSVEQSLGSEHLSVNVLEKRETREWNEWF